ncbi:MAG: M48 family metalloprotease [Alphaproteobacteria bacterium]|nr:M48 family metalloprotease [Alphaproteobacteria bacterium]
MSAFSETFDSFDARTAAGPVARGGGEVAPPSKQNRLKKLVGSNDVYSLSATTKERALSLAFFSCAAVGVCSSLALARDFGALQTALSLMCRVNLPVAVSLASFVMLGRTALFNRTHRDVCGNEQKELEFLQDRAQEYCRKMGMKKTPEIRVWSDKAWGPFGGTASLSVPFAGSAVVFEEKMLATASRQELEGVLGHELAHLKENHMSKWVAFSLASYLFSSPVAFLFAMLPLSFMYGRAQEYQADRIGAAVSGRPYNLAEVLKATSGRVPLDKRWERASFSGKAKYVARAPLKLFLYAYTGMHPPTELRVDRLDAMNPHFKPRKRSLGARFLRYVL